MSGRHDASDQANSRLLALLNQAPEAIFVVDPETLRVVDANATAFTKLGYDRDELLGKNMDALVVGTVAWSGSGTPSEPASRVIEGKHRRRDGEAFPVEWTVSRCHAEQSEYLLIVAREITERKQMEAQLAQSDRLVSVGILAAGVAHEVNNPLAYILNNISYVLAQLRPDQRQLSDALREARMGAERVRDIVKDLKTFSRADDPRIQPVDVCSILDSAIKVASNEIRHRAHLVRRYQLVPPVHASARLGQVFLNLLLNAAHAIDTGNRSNNSITVSVESIEDEVVVRVADTGSGIADDEQHKIFNPFYTTKPVGVGTGLGLAICSSITVSFGGRIEVQSQLGQGATFSVYLPAAKHARVAAARRSSIPPPSLAESLKILVVDDDAFVARSVRRLLSHQHEVDIALSAKEALHSIASKNFDLVFCDVMMPEMTGLELHEQILEQNPALARRFVFITGGPFTPDAQTRAETLQRHCLQKPFTPASLALALEAVLLDVALCVPPLRDLPRA